jgi:hypothetical protein
VKLYAEGDWAKRGPYVEVPDALPVLREDDPEGAKRLADELVAKGTMTREAADRMLRELFGDAEERSTDR